MCNFVLAYFLCLFIAVLLYTIFKGDILNPLVLFCFPLVANYLVYYFMYKIDYELSTKTYVIAVVTSLSLVIGYLLATYIFSKKGGNYYDKQELVVNNSYKKVMLVFGMIGFIVGMIEFLYFGFSGSGAFFVNVRKNYVYGNGVSPISKYGVFCLFCISCVYYYEFMQNKEKYNKRFVYGIMFLALLASLFSMARTSLLGNVLTYIYIYCDSWYKKQRKRKQGVINKRLIKRYLQLFMCFILLIIVFGLFAYVRKNMGGSIFSKDFFLYSYIGYSLVIFDKYFLPFPGATKGYFSLRPFCKVLELLGFLDAEAVHVVRIPPTEFNVASYLSSPYLDYGALGMAIQMMIIGGLVGWVYSKNKKQGGWWTIFYANYMFPIIMAFYSYQFSNTEYLYWLAIILMHHIRIQDSFLVLKLKQRNSPKF